MCSCHSTLECCVMFSGVKLSMGSFVLFWRSGCCYLNKGECNLNQSNHDSFVERVEKNNS